MENENDLNKNHWDGNQNLCFSLFIFVFQIIFFVISLLPLKIILKIKKSEEKWDYKEPFEVPF